MNKKKSTGILLSVLGVVSLVLITAGVTYAFFSYSKEGSTENTISTGTITFFYDELEASGNGIEITDALPISDVEGKVLSGDNNVFNFKVTAITSGNTAIPYEVTARMKADSNADLQDKVKLYLTTVESGTLEETAAPLTVDGTLVKTFSQLTQTSKVDAATAVEKTVFVGTVPASSTNYEQNFKLRMWIADTAAYTPFEYKNITSGAMITSVEYLALTAEEKVNYAPIAYVNTTANTAVTADEYAALADTTGYVAGTQLYPLNGKTFTATINVYANATVVAAPTGV